MNMFLIVTSVFVPTVLGLTSYMDYVAHGAWFWDRPDPTDVTNDPTVTPTLQ